MLWAPYTTSNGQWIANKVLQGLVGAPIESLCEISVSDIVSGRCPPPPPPLPAALRRLDLTDIDQSTHTSTLPMNAVRTWAYTLSS